MSGNNFLLITNAASKIFVLVSWGGSYYIHAKEIIFIEIGENRVSFI